MSRANTDDIRPATGASLVVALVCGTVVALGAALAHLVAEAQGPRLLALVAKPVPVLLLAAAVALARTKLAANLRWSPACWPPRPATC